MTVKHKAQNTGFPVYTIAFEPRFGVNHVVVGGGGGASKAGVPNAVVRYEVHGYNNKDRKQRSSTGGDAVLPPLTMTRMASHDFGSGGDACMSLCVHPKERTVICGVNEPDAAVKSGSNNNCRILFIKSDHFDADVPFSTIDTRDSFHHQKVCKFNRNGLVLVSGTTDGKLSFWTWPQCQSYIPSLNLGGEVIDVDFDDTNSKLVAITPKSLCIIDPRAGNTVLKIEDAKINGQRYQFRAARFGHRKPQWDSGYYRPDCSAEEFYDENDYKDALVDLNEDSYVGTSQFLYVVLNSVDRKSTILCKWYMPGNLRSIKLGTQTGSDVYKPSSDYNAIISPWRLVRKRKILGSTCSAMCVSTNGKMAALAINKDFTIHVYSTKNNLQELYKIQNAHGFAITCLSFSPNDRILVSGSADGTCMVSEVPPLRKGGKFFFKIIMLLIILLVIFVIVGLYMLPEEFDSFADKYIRGEL